jgi:CBS-domain-containing membrane protein
MTAGKMVAGDLIIPLDRYPHLRESNTLQDAVQALLSYTCGDSESLLYCEVFVLNDENQLVGRATLQDLLKALDKRLVEVPRVERFEGKEGDYSNLAILYEDSFYHECSKRGDILLKDIASPVERIAKKEDSLVKMLSILLHGHDQTLPVVEEGSVIGFIRLEEVFKAVCSSCRL